MNSIFLCLAAILLISTSCKGQEENPVITIMGRVFCDTCSQGRFTNQSYFLPGVRVAIKCNTTAGGNTSTPATNGQTDSDGVFTITLPFSFDYEIEIHSCSAHLLHSYNASCNVPSIKTNTKLSMLSKVVNGYVYTAGSLSYRPAKVPLLCDQE